MYSSKSYKTGPGEPHVDNKPKQPPRRMHSGVKKGKAPYGRVTPLSKMEPRLSKMEPRLSKMEGDPYCDDAYTWCWDKGDCDACMDFEDACRHLYDGPMPACGDSATRVVVPQNITAAVVTEKALDTYIDTTSFGPGYQLPGSSGIGAGVTPAELTAMKAKDFATFIMFLNNDPEFVRRNYKNYVNIQDEIETTNSKTLYTCTYDPNNRLTTPIVRGDFDNGKNVIPTDAAIHMINCSRDRAVRMQVEAVKSVGEVAIKGGMENHPSAIEAVVRNKREKCKIRNMIGLQAFDELFAMFDTYGINRQDAINIIRPKMNVVKIENNLGYNVEYSLDNRAGEIANLCSLRQDMDYIATKQAIVMGPQPLTGGGVSHWKRRDMYKTSCKYNAMHTMDHAEECFSAGMQLIASGVGIPKGMQAYPSPHNSKPNEMLMSVSEGVGVGVSGDFGFGGGGVAASIDPGFGGGGVAASIDPGFGGGGVPANTNNSIDSTTCGPSVCPDCPAAPDGASALAAQLAAARASSLTNEVLDTYILFDLVSFLEQPKQGSAPVFFGDPDYNADRGGLANGKNLSFPKSLFRTQKIGCSGDGPSRLDFPDIHAEIMSNQFKTYKQMKFFGHKVLGWAPANPNSNPDNPCDRGEHAITATSDQVSSIKLRYVRRFFYVYYGLVIKEIVSIRAALLEDAVKHKTLAIKSKSINNPEEMEELYKEMDAAGRYFSIAENFFGYAIPYHLNNLRLLNSKLIKLGGAGVGDKLFSVIVTQEDLYREQVVKQGDQLEALESSLTESRVTGGTLGAGRASGDSGEGSASGGGGGDGLWGAVMPPSEADTQQFKTLAKSVIVTLIRDQSPPQSLYEMAFGMDHWTIREELGEELGIDWNYGTKWSEIIQAFMNSWDADASSGREDQPPTAWIKNHIMTWIGYILRHMGDEEEWIISKMGELLTGSKYSNSEGVIMASQFLTILGKSVGLTRAQAVQDVQEASGIVTDLQDNTAALRLQIASLTAQRQEWFERGAEAAASAAAAGEGGAAGETDDTLQKISTSWTNFMTSVGGDIPEPPFEDGGISSEIDYVKTKLVQKHDEMDRLDELVTTMEADLSAARASLVTAQSNVTRIDADLVTANADLVTANADLVTANADNTDLTNSLVAADVCEAEANARDLLSGQITALEGTIETQSETLKTRLDKINELEAGTVEVEGAAIDAAAATTETDLYKDKLKKAKETSAAAIKQKNMIIIGLAVFILILIIVVVVK